MSVKRLSTSVVIACDSAPGSFQQATAIRSVLETFGLQVYFFQLLQKQNVIDFLAGNYPDCDYVILYCYGSPDISGEDRLNFRVAHQQDNDYASKTQWEIVNFAITPTTVKQYIRNPKGTLICGATNGEKWSKAFLSVGYKAYIAPKNPDVACNSFTLFITGFFYHLLMHTLDYTNKRLTPQESAIASAAMDKHYECGTKLFKYYE